MKYLRTIILLLCALFIGSCTQCDKPECELVDKYSKMVGTAIAANLECSNPDAIAEDIMSTIEDLELCKNPRETGVLASTICKPVSILVVQLAIEALPDDWGCKGGAGAGMLESAIYNACSALPF